MGSDQSKEQGSGSLILPGTSASTIGGKRRSNAKHSAKSRRGMRGGSSCMKMTGGRHKGKRHSRNSRRTRSRGRR